MIQEVQIRKSDLMALADRTRQSGDAVANHRLAF